MIFKSIKNANAGGVVEFLSIPDECTLLLAFGFNNNAAARYLQVFLNNVIPVPGSIPSFSSSLVAPNTNFSLAPYLHPESGGLYSANGFIIISSLTPDVLTRSTTNDFWITYQIGKY